MLHTLNLQNVTCQIHQVEKGKKEIFHLIVLCFFLENLFSSTELIIADTNF